MTEYVRGGVAAEQTPQQRRTARIAGWLMLSTFVTSIGALILYQPAFDDGYILGGGDDGQITLAALLEIFLMIGNVGTAVVMFPILRRYSETLSLSYVASRTIEAVIIGVGAISVLSILTLHDDLAGSIGADGTSLDVAGRTLVAIHDWTFLFGPGFCVGINGILLGWMMYRTVARALPPKQTSRPQQQLRWATRWQRAKRSEPDPRERAGPLIDPPVPAVLPMSRVAKQTIRFL
jgi:hypothetical protein